MLKASPFALLIAVTFQTMAEWIVNALVYKERLISSEAIRIFVACTVNAPLLKIVLRAIIIICALC